MRLAVITAVTGCLHSGPGGVVRPDVICSIS
jgi:hypothetical protein